METRFKKWVKPVIKDGKLSKWNWMVQYPKGLKMGKFVDIGAFTYINAANGVEIQDNVEIGSHCSIYSKSTIDHKDGKIVLEKNCKIGTHSVIMPGVKIGENTVIGAFSFVNKDMPANVVAFGVPAKIVRKLNQ